jgi:transcriptional regulator with XRE-family HTH domain
MKKTNGNVPHGTLLTGLAEAFLVQRNKLGFQFQDVERLSGVSSLTISKLEKGKLENTSIDTLEKIAGALELELKIIAEPK